MKGLQPGWMRQSLRNISVVLVLGAIIFLPIVYLYHLSPRNVVSDSPSSPAIATDAAGPVGWSRCLLSIGVDPTGAPSGWRSALNTAIARFGQFGLKFQYEVLRASNPDESVALLASKMDVLITWRTVTDSKVLQVGSQEFPEASLTASGVAGQDVLLAMTNTEIGGLVGAAPSITGASITFNAAVESVFDLSRGPRLADVLTHELGHAIGLAHTSDPGDVMFKYADVRPGGASFTISGRLARSMYAMCRS